MIMATAWAGCSTWNLAREADRLAVDHSDVALDVDDRVRESVGLDHRARHGEPVGVDSEDPIASVDLVYDDLPLTRVPRGTAPRDSC